MKIKLGDLTKRQILNICDIYSVDSPHCSKKCPLYREKIPLCRSFEEQDLNLEIKLVANDILKGKKSNE